MIQDNGAQRLNYYASRNQYQIVVKKSGHMSALSCGLMIYFSWVENALRMFLGVNVEIVECNLRCPNSIYVGLHIVEINKILGYK